MKSPVMNQIGTVFVPVSDVEKARDWYCSILGVEPQGEIQFGHIYVLPMQGTGAVLDSKIYREGEASKVPLFHFNAEDINTAHSFIKEKGAAHQSDIQHDHYFTFQDPDGNTLMVCKC
ncbi:VOC family protein [Metabacillus indicus]|uniref:Glyoxalase n=1 Tax=Metabacillus indicus TaxID=246786 RepID=A0A084H3N0_METID|nr:VOC family protein [Metabacillus indicus]KEZ50034.1 glyoxalase [Metabacillus indicus LMG 22858]KEZ54192.1 glyoxalase [Metabacillus indicus]